MEKKLLQGVIILADASGSKVVMITVAGNKIIATVANDLKDKQKNIVRAKLETVLHIANNLKDIYYLPGFKQEFKAMQSPYGVFEAMRSAVGSVGWVVSGESKYDLPQGEVEEVWAPKGSQNYDAKFSEAINDHLAEEFWDLVATEAGKQ